MLFLIFLQLVWCLCNTLTNVHSVFVNAHIPLVFPNFCVILSIAQNQGRFLIDVKYAVTFSAIVEKVFLENFVKRL